MEPGVLYYDIGPTLNISEPFTLNLYLSSSNYGGENTVFFNGMILREGKQYSLGNINLEYSVSYGIYTPFHI